VCVLETAPDTPSSFLDFVELSFRAGLDSIVPALRIGRARLVERDALQIALAGGLAVNHSTSVGPVVVLDLNIDVVHVGPA